MPEQDESGADRNEADYYEKGNDIARRGRTEKPRLKVLRDELPEFTNDELHRLYDNIENAIRDEVVGALREKHGRNEPTGGSHAYLLSLTQAQLEQLQNDDIAVVDTDREKFVFVPKSHETEAIDHLHANDVEVTVQEVTERD